MALLIDIHLQSLHPLHSVPQVRFDTDHGFSLRSGVLRTTIFWFTESLSWLIVGLSLSGGILWNGALRFGYTLDLLRFWLVLVCISLWIGVPLQNLSFVRRKWLLQGLATLLLLAFFAHPLVRHWALHSWLFDLAVMENIISRASQGLGATSTLLGSVAQPFHYVPHNHLNLWLYPIALIYRFAPFTESLLLLQSAALLWPMIPLYRLGKLRKHEIGLPPIVLPLLYWGWDTVHKVNVWDFHETPLMVGFGVWAGVFFYEKRWIPCALSLIAFALFKEDAWMTAGLMAFVFLVQKKRPMLGAVCVLTGIGVFLFHALALNHVNSIQERFSYLAPTAAESLRILAARPWVLVEEICKPQSLLLLGQLLTVCGGAWAFSGVWILPLLPTLLFCLLSTHGGMLSFESHHIFALAAPLLLASVEGLIWLKRAPRLRLSLLLLGFMFLSSNEIYSIRKYLRSDQWRQRKCVSDVLQKIPSTAFVYAGDPFVAQIGGRTHLQIYDPSYTLSEPDAYWVSKSDTEPCGIHLGQVRR